MAVRIMDALVAPTLPARGGETWEGMEKKQTGKKIQQHKEK